MKTIVAFAIICFASALALPLQVVDYEGEEHFLVPVSRARRQVIYSGGRDGNGKFATLGGSGTAFENNNHKVDVTGTATKYFPGPVIGKGGADYLHKPSGSTASINAMHVPKYGTDVRADVNANIWKSSNGMSTVGAGGFYERHYGGFGGTGKPNYGAGINFNHRF